MNIDDFCLGERNKYYQDAVMLLSYIVKEYFNGNISISGDGFKKFEKDFNDDISKLSMTVIQIEEDTIYGLTVENE